MLVAAGLLLLRWQRMASWERRGLAQDELATDAVTNAKAELTEAASQRREEAMSRQRERAGWGQEDLFCPRASCAEPSGPNALRPSSIRMRR